MINHIYALVTYSLEKNLIKKEDIDYAVNQLSYKTQIEPNVYIQQNIENQSFVELIEPILVHAIDIGLIDDSIQSKDNFESYLMDTFTMRPSCLQDTFASLDSKEATKFFYKLCQDNHYIKTERINKNKQYTYNSSYGDIFITINLSKPEKDPKTIAKLKHKKTSQYPACLLCKENIGYYGNISHPGRSNHRAISISLNNEPFFFQYSPYVYYNEHTIVFHKEHIPMKLSKKTFLRLFDFVDRFPHYFLGSNAGLPIIGGSILNHEHYQGGSADFPIQHAEVIKSYQLDNVKLELLKWPLSVIRLTSKDRETIIDISNKLRVFYENYSDESVDLIAKTNEQHNAITPIVRKESGTYIVDIALRNNRTNEAYPDGIFHPHPDIHAIKKENIGLIEVMGLAILPGRLLSDLEEIQNVLDNQLKLAQKLSTYKDWVNTIIHNPEYSTKENIEQAVARTFVKGLEDCGVFKQTDNGIKHFKLFIEAFLNE